jgi:hypothetical protein
MKILAAIIGLLTFVVVGNAQTPISTFPYFYDWTNPAAFSKQLDNRTYVGGDGHWGSYIVNNTSQFVADAAGLAKTNQTFTWDTLFAKVNATGRIFTGTEVFKFDASRTGGSWGLLRVYANSTLILSKSVNTDLSTSWKSFSASLPQALGNTNFTVSIVVFTTDIVKIDNTSISGGALPITLASFTLNPAAGSVMLNWTTISEIDNYGFYVQKSDDSKKWSDVANSFQPGYGTTVEQHFYTFTDNTQPTCKYYRLRQVDLDGTNHYSDALSDVATSADPAPVAKMFALHQNYPNPFNPSTTISYSLPKQSHATLTIYNTIGEQVAALVNEVVTAGEHSIVWYPANLSSGTYFCVLKSDNQMQVRKIVFVK